MWPSRSKTSHSPSGETSTDIQVPSVVVKAISRVSPRGIVMSHSAGDWADAGGLAAAARVSKATASAGRMAASAGRVAGIAFDTGFLLV